MTHELETSLADVRYPEAKRIVAETGNTTAAHLQRRMDIGYNRAARFLEAMEAEGLVSKFDNAGHRTMLGAAPAADPHGHGSCSESAVPHDQEISMTTTTATDPTGPGAGVAFANRLGELLFVLRKAGEQRGLPLDAALLAQLQVIARELAVGVSRQPALKLLEAAVYLDKLAKARTRSGLDSEAACARNAAAAARGLYRWLNPWGSSAPPSPADDAARTSSMLRAMAAIEARFLASSTAGADAREATISRAEFDTLSAYLERYELDEHECEPTGESTELLTANVTMDLAIDLIAKDVSARADAPADLHSAVETLRGMAAKLKPIALKVPVSPVATTTDSRAG